MPDECYFVIDIVLRQAEEKILAAPAEKQQEYLRRYFKFAQRVRAYNKERIMELERRKYRY